MQLDIKSEEEFEGLLNDLISELFKARTHYKLYCDLLDSIKDFEREMNQSPAFWIMTFQAHIDAAMIGLCRIYEQNKTVPYTLNLRNFLETIKESFNLFEETSFRERLKENQYVDSLAAVDRKPNLPQLEEDIKYASLENELVKRLTIWRNNIIAHKSPNGVTRQLDFMQSYPLSRTDIMDLIDRAANILNDYSNLYRARTNSWQIVGHDDYKAVLKAVRSDLDHREAELQKEIEEYESQDRKASA